MNLDRIRRIQRRERRSDDLCELEENFFTDIQEYISNLEKEATENSEKLDELRNARRAFQGLFDRRLRKILGMVAASSEVDVGTRPLTPEEKRLFRDLETSIDRHRKLLHNPQKDNKERDEEKETSELTLVKVLEDKEFVGPDEQPYDLKKDQVANLPTTVVNALKSMGAIEEIKPEEEIK